MAQRLSVLLHGGVASNSEEGWHHAFQSAVSCHHPSVYKLIERIQTVQDPNEQQLAQFLAGSRTAASCENKYIQVIRRLTALLPRYGNRPPGVLLDFAHISL